MLKSRFLLLFISPFVVVALLLLLLLLQQQELQGSRRDQEEGSGAGSSSYPRRNHEQGGGAGLRKLDFSRFGLFLNSSATDIVLLTLPSTAVETANAQCTSRWAMARGHRLNTSIVTLAAVHGLSGPFRAVSAVEPSLSRPLPPLSPSLISHLASVDVKQDGQQELLQLSTTLLNTEFN